MTKEQIQKRAVGLVEKINEPEEFVEELHSLLHSFGGEKAKAGIQRFIPGVGKTFGTSLPVLRIISNEIGKFGKKNPEKVLPLLRQLWQNGSREERIIVAKVLEKSGGADYRASLALISSFLSDISDWEACDQLACFGMKPLVSAHPEEVLPLCERWVRDKNKWIRRFGVVSLVSLVRKQVQGKALGIIGLLMEEEDQDVKKAVAWILREATKGEPEMVYGFLKKWAKRDDKNTRWIIKDGMKKLSREKQDEIIAVLT